MLAACLKDPELELGGDFGACWKKLPILPRLCSLLSMGQLPGELSLLVHATQSHLTVNYLLWDTNDK